MYNRAKSTGWFLLPLFAIRECIYWRINNQFFNQKKRAIHSVVSDSATPWIVACLAPLSVGFSRQKSLEWIATPFSRGSSQPSNWTQISCIAGGFFTVELPGNVNNFVNKSACFMQIYFNTLSCCLPIWYNVSQMDSGEIIIKLVDEWMMAITMTSWRY